MKTNICVGRESNPDQLLGRQLCSPLYHRRIVILRCFNRVFKTSVMQLHWSVAWLYARIVPLSRIFKSLIKQLWLHFVIPPENIIKIWRNVKWRWQYQSFLPSLHSRILYFFYFFGWVMGRDPSFIPLPCLKIWHFLQCICDLLKCKIRAGKCPIS